MAILGLADVKAPPVDSALGAGVVCFRIGFRASWLRLSQKGKCCEFRALGSGFRGPFRVAGLGF